MNLLENRTVSLLSSLFFVTSDSVLWMNNVTIPNTLGGVFVLFIIFLFIKILKINKSLNYEIMTLFFMLLLILTHTISSLFLGIILICFWVSSIYYIKFQDTLKFNENPHDKSKNFSKRVESPERKNHKQRQSFSISIDERLNNLSTEPHLFPKYLLLMFIVGLLSYWIYISGTFNILIELVKAGFSIERFLLTLPPELVTHYYSNPFDITIYNSLGSILLYSVSFIGIFYLISKKGKYITFIFSITAIILFLITFISEFGFYNMSYRFPYFNFMFFSIFFSISLVLIFNLINHKAKKNIFIISMTFIITFLMVTNSTSTIKDGLFSYSHSPDLSMTPPELQSIYSVNKMANETIDTDYYTHYVMNYLEMNSTDISYELLNGDFLKNHRILLIHNDLNIGPIRMYKVNFKINFNPVENLDNNYFSKIYSSNSYYAFYYS
jgi:hypothetical protein